MFFLQHNVQFNRYAAFKRLRINMNILKSVQNKQQKNKKMKLLSKLKHKKHKNESKEKNIQKSEPIK